MIRIPGWEPVGPFRRAGGVRICAMFGLHCYRSGWNDSANEFAKRMTQETELPPLPGWLYACISALMVVLIGWTAWNLW